MMTGPMARGALAAVLVACAEPGPPGTLLPSTPDGYCPLREVGSLSTALPPSAEWPATVTDLAWAELGGAPGPEVVAAIQDLAYPMHAYWAGAVAVLEVTDDELSEVHSYRVEGELAVGLSTVSAGDLDGDGDIDLVVGSNTDGQYDGDGEVAVLLNAGQAFEHLATLGDDAEFLDTRVFDVNGDGTLDVLAAAGYAYYAYGFPALAIWTNDGTAEFTWNSGVSGYAYRMDVRAGADGAPLVALDRNLDGARSLDVFRYDAGALVPANPGEFASAAAAVLTDADNDGDLEVLDADLQCSDFVGCTVETADLDLDGDEDFVLADSNVLTAYLNDGAGEYTLAWTLEVDNGMSLPTHLRPLTPVVMALTDRDGDGDIDFAVGTYDRVYVFDNTLR
jgi:FG-GAP-like repeat